MVRVIATNRAAEISRRMQVLLRGSLRDQMAQLMAAGKTLSDARVWDGRDAVLFRQATWPRTTLALRSSIEVLDRMLVAADKVIADIMAAGTNGNLTVAGPASRVVQQIPSGLGLLTVMTSASERWTAMGLARVFHPVLELNDAVRRLGQGRLPWTNHAPTMPWLRDQSGGMLLAVAPPSGGRVLNWIKQGAHGILELASLPPYAAYYVALRTDSSLSQLENHLPGPLKSMAQAVDWPLHGALDAAQVSGLGWDVGIDQLKHYVGGEPQINDEGVNNHIGPFQTGPIWYLPGWWTDDPSHLDFSWSHPLPWSRGFGPISKRARP